MAQDTQSKKESPGTQGERVEMPKYEYQKDDNRSYSVSFALPEKHADKPASKNVAQLKVF